MSKVNITKDSTFKELCADGDNLWEIRYAVREYLQKLDVSPSNSHYNRMLNYYLRELAIEEEKLRA